ncbi:MULTISPECIES: alpha/beta fold hydrolase [Vibrio]|uniref:Alpha/beta hydrolase n=1 Tax=Vibrio bivalvicida TaxID=1276888 RepID=A0A177XV25_9VIBR|nr:MULTISPECIES: alpha/beta fold hydrolase [Vibrio]OAJ92369.1 alpha/beta hydrolase [Vibrio bivalvicida]
MTNKAAVLTTIVSFIIGMAGKPSSANEFDAEIEKTTEGLAFVRVANPQASSRVIFIHGSPGSHAAYTDYLSDEMLKSQAELISVDRLGYGESSPNLVTSLDRQAAAIGQLLAKDKANILVGHSLGATIALALAIQLPNMVDGLVLVAPALDAKLEEPKWYNEIADTWLINWLLSRDWQRSNGEMMPLAKELSDLSAKDWTVLDERPVTLIHGKEDTIADPENSAFAIAKLTGKTKKYLEVEKEGHFILWQNIPLISEQIQQIVLAADQVKEH